MAHSVQNHLHIAVADYDRVIRTYIPGYEEMLDTVAWWLGAIVPKDGKVIDLGGGTGSLAEAILSRLPEIHVEIWDVDPQMMELARGRLSSFGNRATVTERSFLEKIDSCDAVAASIALHHIPKMETKRDVYANIYSALRTHGIFLNADATIDDTEPGRAAMYRWWSRFMGTKGISETEAYKLFDEWAAEDTYQPLTDELAALGKAGFRRPEVFWKFGPMTVYGGIK
jgi:ubiquinone/menaquinone biosynthesis C-methylase UbiE